MRRACFIHVFKTGGTSVADWLDTHYSNPAVPADAYDFQDNAARYSAAPLIRGHLCARDVLTDRGRVFFTMLRRPEAQVMSALWHLVSQRDLSREHRPFNPEADLMAKAQEYAWRLGQYRFFQMDPKDHDSGLQGLARMHAVGLTERLHDSLRLFAWRLGLPAPRKAPHARPSGAGEAIMPDTIASVMAEALPHDRRLYRLAEALFERDFGMLCDTAGGAEHVDDWLDQASTAPASPISARKVLAFLRPSR